LHALVREHLDHDITEATRLGSGASVLADGEGWIYFPNAVPGLLGTAVIWGAAQDCRHMNLIVDEGAGHLAHAASMFSEPAPIVWQVSGRSMSIARPTIPVIVPPPECVSLTAELANAGLDVVADHGVWLGEVNGLEVARVGIREGECEMDIGVGAYDQFASAALRADRSDELELDRVISMVRPHRTAGAEPHALGRLVRSRWLRSQVTREPGLIGLDLLNPIPLLWERPGLMETQPAAGLGRRGDIKVLVVFSVGLDLGVVETAAGLAALHSSAPDHEGIEEVLVVVPERDMHQRILDSVSALALPAFVIPLEGEWAG